MARNSEKKSRGKVHTVESGTGIVLELLLEAFPNHHSTVEKVCEMNKGASEDFLSIEIHSEIDSSFRFPKYKDEFKLEKPEHVEFMVVFHTSKCPGNCENCLLQHGQKQPIRRRPERNLNTGKWNYMPELCKNDNRCPKGEQCEHAHTEEEIAYHPIKYKTTICEKRQKCLSDPKICPLAHGPKDRRKPSHAIVPITNSLASARISAQAPAQKSVKVFTKADPFEKFSPKTFKIYKCTNPNAHDRELCCKFHTSEDERRNPEHYEYIARPCEHVYNTTDKSFFPEQCPLKEKCSYAHNKIEINYHPEFYQKYECRDPNCKYEEHCAFIHNSVVVPPLQQIPKRPPASKQIEEFNSLQVEIRLLTEKVESLKTDVSRGNQFLCYLCNDEYAVSAFSCGHMICRGCEAVEQCPNCPSSGTILIPLRI